MKKSIIIAIGVVFIIGITGAAYWWGTQQKTAPKIPPTQTISPSPTSISKNGTIEGSLSFPSEGIPKNLEVCAENQTTKEIYCTSKHLQNPKYTYGVGYTLNVPAGIYLVYALDPSGDYKAYYSEFVTCGLSVNCPSHEPILVEVKAGETTSDVDPQDWYK